MNYKNLEDLYEIQRLYQKRGIVIVKGQGSKIFDESGKEYIDCIAGQGVANIGHSNPDLIKAVKEQIEKITICPEIFYNDKRAEILEKLASISPIKNTRIFLCNSGAESIEAAIKFARFATNKTDFICAFKSFHGRTYGALSATHHSHYKEGFEPLVPGFEFVPFNNAEKIKEKVSDKTAGIILEVVQGIGGVRIADKEYLREVRKLCEEKNIILIIDEVQSGFCRTGKMFACQNFELEPDILCCAKSIAGGLPMAAVLCSEKIKIDAGKHGSTFGGNPLSCAAALASINFMQERLLDKEAEEKGRFFMSKLSEIKSEKIKEVRGLGLMIGIELNEKVSQYVNSLQEKGVLVISAGPNVIRFLPPLIITYEEINFVLEKVKEVLK